MGAMMDGVTPSSHTHTEGDSSAGKMRGRPTGLQGALPALAPLDAPWKEGRPSPPPAALLPAPHWAKAAEQYILGAGLLQPGGGGRSRPCHSPPHPKTKETPARSRRHSPELPRPP